MRRVRDDAFTATFKEGDVWFHLGTFRTAEAASAAQREFVELWVSDNGAARLRMQQSKSKAKSGQWGIAIRKNNTFTVYFVQMKRSHYVGTYKDLASAIAARDSYCEKEGLRVK